MIKEKTKKIISIVINVIVWIFLVFALAMMIFALSSAANSDGMPVLFKKSFISVQSDSMKPVFEKGDLLICKTLSDNDKAQLKCGTVVTFREDLNGDGVLEFKSHRIVAIYANGEKISDTNGSILAGHENDYKTKIISYETQGYNLEMCPTVDSQKTSYTDVLCVWYDGGVILKGVGKFLDFVGSSKGFLIIIVIPMAIFFLYEVYNLIFLIIKMRQQKQLANAPKFDEEEIKRKAIEEYLRQEALKKQEESSSNEQVEPSNEDKE